MKIYFPENYKNRFTIEDMEHCKIIRNCEWKPDESEVSILVNYFFKLDARILETKAEYATNFRACDCYGLSGDMDIWLTVYAYNETEGFKILSAYVSDVWQLCKENFPYIKTHMYIREYVEK